MRFWQLPFPFPPPPVPISNSSSKWCIDRTRQLSVPTNHKTGIHPWQWITQKPSQKHLSFNNKHFLQPIFFALVNRLIRFPVNLPLLLQLLHSVVHIQINLHDKDKDNHHYSFILHSLQFMSNVFHSYFNQLSNYIFI
jgi:hypothetical protein